MGHGSWVIGHGSWVMGHGSLDIKHSLPLKFSAFSKLYLDKSGLTHRYCEVWLSLSQRIVANCGLVTQNTFLSP